MTTIILTVIGILLAAAAALMIIFYGGDAFNSGSVGAQANTLQNAGTNVLTASQMFYADHRADPANVAALTAADANGDGDAYLDSAPSLQGVSGITTADINAAGTRYEVAGVSTEVCTKVNRNLGITGTPTGAEKMGCLSGTFYATL